MKELAKPLSKFLHKFLINKLKQDDFLDLAKDITGKRKGPKDLASNPNYMKRFGQ